MDRVDDLGVVDPSQVRRGDPEVGMSKLSLDHRERHAFPVHLNGVCVAELMGSEPSRDARLLRCEMQLNADRCGGARPTARRAAQDAEQRADREL